MKFKLPKRVKIGGTRYVVTREREHESTTGNKATINHRRETIIMDPETNQIHSLLHEIVHGVDWFLCPEKNLTENEVERITEAVKMFIADNPRLLHHLANCLDRKC